MTTNKAEVSHILYFRGWVEVGLGFSGAHQVNILKVYTSYLIKLVNFGEIEELFIFPPSLFGYSSHFSSSLPRPLLVIHQLHVVPQSPSPLSLAACRLRIMLTTYFAGNKYYRYQ